jgi:hypothetical protein
MKPHEVILLFMVGAILGLTWSVLLKVTDIEKRECTEAKP